LKYLQCPGRQLELKQIFRDEFYVGVHDGKTYLKFNLGINANATDGGELPVASNYLFRFKVIAASSPSNIINLAQIQGYSLMDELFSDESTAIIYVNFGTGNFENHIACDSFEWRKNAYKKSGIYYYDYINTLGLPATDTLFLIIKKSSKSFNVLSVCPTELPYVWNGLIFTEPGIKTILLTNSVGCDSLATLELNVSNCDPPCYTENFNSNSINWTNLSNGARIENYNNPLNNCLIDRGIITPGVGGFDPAKIQTPQYTSSGAKRIKLSFDLYPFDANMRCNSWKNYNCPTSIDVIYYVGRIRYVGVADFVLPENGPFNSPYVTLVFPVGTNLPIGTRYSVEIVFKKKNGIGNCIQQNTKYVIDNFSICELQCESCPLPTTTPLVNAGNIAPIVSVNSEGDIAIWPNPSSDVINIAADRMPLSVEIFDVLGKQILRVVNQKTIDISKLKPGTYFVRVNSSDSNSNTKQIQIIR
jgi:hypothetical protein